MKSTTGTWLETLRETYPEDGDSADHLLFDLIGGDGEVPDVKEDEDYDDNDDDTSTKTHHIRVIRTCDLQLIIHRHETLYSN
jgi:hypothetical protein